LETGREGSLSGLFEYLFNPKMMHFLHLAMLRCAQQLQNVTENCRSSVFAIVFKHVLVYVGDIPLSFIKVRHDITELLLKVALYTIIPTLRESVSWAPLFVL
jgi:hypothetical protein